MLLPLPSSSSMDRRRHQCQKIILRITPVRPRASISTTPPKIIPDHSVEVGSERMSQERKSARARGREGEAERKGGREGERNSIERPASSSTRAQDRHRFSCPHNLHPSSLPSFSHLSPLTSRPATPAQEMGTDIRGIPKSV